MTNAQMMKILCGGNLSFRFRHSFVLGPFLLLLASFVISQTPSLSYNPGFPHFESLDDNDGNTTCRPAATYR